MNESMLTGESIPVIKQCIPNLNSESDGGSITKYTLFGGTEII